MTRTNALFTLLAVALCAGPARAVDGVLEINQTCAVRTGCFPGDTAGFPVTITSSTPGASFRLTSDLVVPDSNPGGILILSVPGVSIDLNQFSIIRAACHANPIPACMPAAGTTDGIEANPADNYTGTSVRNGSVVGMSRYGVQLGFDSEALNLRVRFNASTGILAGWGRGFSTARPARTAPRESSPSRGWCGETPRPATAVRGSSRSAGA